MSPDKLFDYLDGKLAPAEREQLEEKLMSDEQLRREFNIAREIHRGGGVSREVVVPTPEDLERGGRLGRRVFIVAIALVFANVIGGLAFIAYKNTKPSPAARPASTPAQQLEPLVRSAAENAMPLPTFVPAEIQLVAPRAEWENLAGRIIATAVAFGGEGQKGLPDEEVMTVLADIPSEREEEFRRAVSSATPMSSPIPTATPSESNKRTIVQVRIAEATP